MGDLTMKRVTLLLIVFAAVTFSGCSYNELTAKHQNVKGKWADVESAMQRRADLLPNLFEAAKAAGFNEQEVFGKISDARAKLAGLQNQPPAGDGGARSPEQKQEIIQANSALSRLLVVFENYPTLRSNEAFLKVQDQVEGTENRLDVARRDYNQAVTDYNTTRNQFPAVITASIVGFAEEPFFEADEGANEVPRMDANDMKSDS
ncbi:MAG: LemA family protein [Acidobacteria bacterium]|nr:MAG: LemA family protein [Acidobacteriota bacterium]REK02312.1 MAG: LemA family protein [Acidobacteriota bacterium]REK13885.1 MAG: LemA family protein [Acidobacteriota bacterium]REK41879.1 MAG: LemA family protein [Acidobacteriota bacterium]